MAMLKHRVFAISLHKHTPLARRQGLLLSAPWFRHIGWDEVYRCVLGYNL